MTSDSNQQTTSRLSVGDNGVVSWPCRDDEPLQCDGVGYEPIDVSRDRCVASRELTPKLAVPVKILVPGALDAVTLEWRQPSSHGTTLIATRKLSVSEGAIDVPVSYSPRVLRVFRSGAAPVSLAFKEPPDSRVATLPYPEHGGELFILNDAVEMPPVELLGVGDRSFALDLKRQSYARAAVVPGDYQFHLLYSSGVRTDGVAGRIEDGRTLELAPADFGPVGAAMITAEPQLLEQEGVIRVLRQTEIGTAVTQTEVWSSESRGQSSWFVDGLSAGSYEAQLELLDGTLIRNLFSVAGGARSQVRMAGGTTRVFGHVTIGGRPAKAGTRIHFAMARQLKPFEAIIDTNGNYSVTLGEPGRYTVRLMTAKYLSTWTDGVVLKAGLNKFDWVIPGGSLEITMRRDDASRIDEIVQLHIESPGFHAAAPIVPEEANTPLLVVGLPLSEEFTVRADTRSSLVAEPVKIGLTTTRPHREIELVLRDATSVLEVRSASTGDLLPDATAVAGNLNIEQDPLGSGYFKIRRTSPGTALLVKAPGRVPVCRVLRATDVPTLQLRLPDAELIPVEIRLDVRATRPVGFFMGLPGSDCPVPLMDVGPEMKYDGEGVVFSVRLPAGTYQYTPYGRFPLQTFTVPGPGLSLHIPQQKK